MREELLDYYERELTYLRQMGAEFSRKHPRVAGRLLLEPDRCEDPHVERLLEGFAFLAARVHLRIDDDLPDLASSLLNVVYPYYLRPVPAATVVECAGDPAQGKQTAAFRMPAATQIVTKKTVNGIPCRFRTCYDVDLWPINVTDAEWRLPERLKNPVRMDRAAAVARLSLACMPDVKFQDLAIDRLRFYVAGDAAIVYSIYELLSVNCQAILLRSSKDPSTAVSISTEQLRMVGFDPQERLLPYEPRSFDGYRLLQEYFSFPEKFLFFEVTGLQDLQQRDFGDEAELLFLFSRFERPERQQLLELGVNSRTFRLGCTPAINLFQHSAEPILLNQKAHEYRVVPDASHSDRMEIFNIDEVSVTNPKTRQSNQVDPVLAYRHQTRQQDGRVYWTATRKMNVLGEHVPSSMFISLVDLDGEVTDPSSDVLAVRCQCTNFDLPSRLPLGVDTNDFEAVGYPAVKTIKALHRPSTTVGPPYGKGQVWRLISHLSLNYLSLSEQGRGALQEILRLHNFTDSTYLENQIGSISSLSVNDHFALISSRHGLIPARGMRVDIEFDEQQFAGAGVYLFASVIERFLGGYVSINSFCQLVARTTLRKEMMREWPPRAGNQVLI